jgi:Flp pilus assembly protein TadB
VSRERAHRRAERERAAAVERERRARVRARQERSRRRREAVRSALPERRRSTGLLAARRRRRLAWLLGTVVVVQVVAWPFLPSWTARVVLLAICLMLVPLAWVLMFGRVG